MKLLIVILSIFASTQCASFSNKAEPVQLLNLSSGNRSDILYNADAIQNLFLHPKLRDRNVVVFSIVGAFRKGKSFLMNYVLRYMYAHYKSVLNDELINPGDDWLGGEHEPLTGFDWKSGTARVTTGLILWSDVFLYDDPNGDKLAIYLMDTQGLFDHKTTTADNSKVFSLSTMISSIQILNVVNIMQENQLQYLQFATSYAIYASDTQTNSPFQNLMILIRDWGSPDEYEYGIRGGKGYLNQFLSIHDYQTKELQSVRRYMKTSFDKIDCFLMAHPGKKVAFDSSYNGSWSPIDEDFIAGMKDLFAYLFSPKKLAVKKINGVAINAEALLVFINTYVESFKNESLPTPSGIYDSTMEQQFKILMGKCIDIYVNTIAAHDKELQDEDGINQLHKLAKDKGMDAFKNEKKFGTNTEGNVFKKDLEKSLQDSFVLWKGISLNHIRDLKVLKEKTDHQLDEARKAQQLDDKAKVELDAVNEKAKEAKLALDKARSDTEEARREAKELADKFAKAEIEQADARAKEEETRKYLNKMTTDKAFYEREYNELKQKALQSVGQSLGETQQQGSALESIVTVLQAAAPVITMIASFFG